MSVARVEVDTFLTMSVLASLHGVDVEHLKVSRQTLWRWKRSGVPVVYMNAAALAMLSSGVPWSRLVDLSFDFPEDHSFQRIVANLEDTALSDLERVNENL